MKQKARARVIHPGILSLDANTVALSLSTIDTRIGAVFINEWTAVKASSGTGRH
ncbi:hypothetical protein [Salinivibrio socompensis]|uniref:hypothetical protein n=1 Tax=Salinivibrio socompensis TaxID=1510206 RepID=UPI0004B2EEC2|nr:hypothetical protein [Salinivibrio socompensis]